MECRTFDITLISGNNLERTRFCRMKVYARVSIGSTAEHQKRTPTDRHGATNPAWNFTLKYNLHEPMVQHYSTMLVVKLFSRRRLACDRYVGEVHTSLKELFEVAEASGGSAILTFPVKFGSLTSQGELKFSCRFGERVTVERRVLAESVAEWTQC